MGGKCFINWNPEECCNVVWKDIFVIEHDYIDINRIKTSSYYFNPNKHTNTILEEMIHTNTIQNIEYLVIEGGHEFKHPHMSPIDFIHKKFYSIKIYNLFLKFKGK